MVIRMLAATLALVTAVPACASVERGREIAGMYEIDQMEMAGGLLLQADGRFGYSLDYGAVSEVSVGAWTVEGDTILLTTQPMPKAAECDRGFAAACFNRTPLNREDGNLILWRWDARIVLKPIQPRPR